MAAVSFIALALLLVHCPGQLHAGRDIEEVGKELSALLDLEGDTPTRVPEGNQEGT